MKNVILSENPYKLLSNGKDCQDVKHYIAPFQEKAYDEGVKAGESHLLKILMEPCTEHKLPVYSVLNINLPAHRKDCPDCMAEIQRQVNG
jgi:hypothetical protein